MNFLKVGEPFLPNKTNWPEKILYTSENGAHNLIIFMSNPSLEEIESVRNGQHSFGLFVEENITFLLFKFEPKIKWSDAPFIPNANGEIPFFAENNQVPMLNILYVDSVTGILKTYRMIGLEEKFSNILRESISKQLLNTINPNNLHQRINNIYKKYPRSEMMLNNAIFNG
ncbi:hypothetical protein [Leptospira noguchii]|uniref:Uncharacterized protein n=1 Tax=Leptospira noguchii TaxID=28182 RepID=M6VD02_9LEPT|nr:hypothetical protein [Leptospira noguchii]EMO54760.1 hypothetical protein LEP1GSC172_4310 [Leptospira noguchii]